MVARSAIWIKHSTYFAWISVPPKVQLAINTNNRIRIRNCTISCGWDTVILQNWREESIVTRCDQPRVSNSKTIRSENCSTIKTICSIPKEERIACSTNSDAASICSTISNSWITWHLIKTCTKPYGTSNDSSIRITGQNIWFRGTKLTSITDIIPEIGGIACLTVCDVNSRRSGAIRSRDYAFKETNLNTEAKAACWTMTGRITSSALKIYISAGKTVSWSFMQIMSCGASKTSRFVCRVWSSTVQRSINTLLI